ncbi:MAG: formate dehydrogenase [Pseudomonadota bacterium]|nr:formate dehydrogenase [Pseudomonadota bacterium]
MKFSRSQRPPTTAPGEPVVQRRGVVVGAGLAAAAALAAAAVHRQAVDPAEALPAKQPKVAGGDGYQLTDHVLRYYQTTRS